MRAHSNRIFALAIAALLMLGTVPAFGQTDGGGDDAAPAAGGIEIDANNVLTTRTVVANSNALSQKRWQNAQVTLNKEIQKVSELRKVSLVRLEQEVARLQAEGTNITDDVRFLAGLTRITHVFFYPEENDIVIAGPAEGFYLNGQNRIVGMESHKATLQLEDLVAALRAFGPDGNRASLISCSIDPTQEGLQRFQQTYRQVAANYQGPHQVREVGQAFFNAMGLQTITIKGVSPKTHFAHTMAEADYAMKLIGLGLRDTPVKITTFVDKTKPRFAKSNALTRWFFQPDYSCVHMTEDKRSMQLVGNGVKLVGEDESVSAAGNRKGRGAMNPASKAFTSSFTRMYSKLAEQEPLFAELRNLIDLSIVAAFIQKMDIYSQADWKLTTFGDESIVPVENRYPLKKVAPVINAFYKGSSFMTPIAGGVSIQPRVALNSDRINLDETGDIQKTRDSVAVDLLEDGQWWWD